MEKKYLIDWFRKNITEFPFYQFVSESDFDIIDGNSNELELEEIEKEFLQSFKFLLPNRTYRIRLMRNIKISHQSDARILTFANDFKA